MPTFGFVLRALAWVAALFGTMRLSWVQDHLLVPSASLQHGLACALTGAPRDAVVVDQSCTGSDAMALCLGAIFAFPASWRRRLLGAAIGLGFILAFNTARIGSLSLVVDDRDLFQLLHIYVWPAVIVLVAAVYVYFWMSSAVTAEAGRGGPVAAAAASAPRSGALVRFLLVATGLVALYYLLYSRWLASDLLTTIAEAVARTSGLLLAAVGIEVTVGEQIVRTSQGAWYVTPECATTPLIPIYLAAVLTVQLRPLQRGLAILATVPLFFALAVSRLLVLALPQALIGSPTDAVHAFYQVLAAAGLVALTAWRLADRQRWDWRLATGLTVGVAAAALLAPLDPLRSELWRRLAGAAHLGHGVVDGQGALALLPAFQIGLFLALWQAGNRGWRPRSLAPRLLVLLASQLVVVTAVGELATHLEASTPIVLIRAWALFVPPLLAWPLRGRGGEPAGNETESSGYQGFWDQVGAEFPDLGGAVSTSQYLEGEQRLLRQAFGELEGRRLFKTDLWDEARNTRILQWASERGARAYGIDISAPTLLMAQREFGLRRQRLTGVVADVRAIPFRDGAFDAAYSMGTVEHFAETEAAVAEIARVVRPGGRAVIGVPNRHDPFLRPLLVAILYRLGLYDYGLEKSYSHAQLGRICRRAGFAPLDESGLLFVPGGLRMLDLACWAWARPLARLTGLAVRPFAWLERRWPRLRRHGYLIAAIVERPAAETAP